MTKSDYKSSEETPYIRRVRWVLWFCGLYITQLGCLLCLGLIASFLYPEIMLVSFLGKLKVPLGALAGNSWIQVAIAFGLHSCADVNAGVSMMNLVTADRNKCALPTHVSVWNTIKCLISFLWMLKIGHGLFHMTLNKKVEPNPSIYTLLFMVLLAADALLIRPLSVYMQRILSDHYPPRPKEIQNSYDSLGFVRKVCRFLFFVEGVAAGCIGAAYFMFPELFIYLYGYPVTDSDAVTLWCLSQFGVLIMALGLFQISCELDQHRVMMAWWLNMNGLWLYEFWEGSGSRLGVWNPFMLTGATLWCHAAFHLVAMFAAVRWISLALSFISNSDITSSEETASTASETTTSKKKK